MAGVCEFIVYTFIVLSLTTSRQFKKIHMQSYKDLIVWNKSIELVVQIYHLTGLFPIEEKYGLVSQMRRSTVSVPSNIAEGYARKNTRENAQFVNIAYGSATELDTQIIISKKLQIIQEYQTNSVDILIQEILKLLYNYRKYLQQIT